jgi:N-acetylglucosaminyldiphosphoundecaprenol N-acetyl-beta-D-mannosaminyltransferase
MALKESVAKDLGNKNVVGTYSPPFRPMNEMEFKTLGEMINASGANVVWIGLGTPKQEKFAYTLSSYCKVDYIITVGAVFDFFTGNLPYAPLWIRNLGLEWLYRLIKEPRRLFGRYIVIVPAFIWLNLKEFFTSLFSSK